MTEESRSPGTENDQESADTDHEPRQHSSRNGPKFTESPDPISTVRKGASDLLAGMEGKTVSMKVYIGSILAVVILMMLARCGG